MALVGDDVAEVRQVAGLQVGRTLRIVDHVLQRALRAGEVQEGVVLGGIQRITTALTVSSGC